MAWTWVWACLCLACLCEARLRPLWQKSLHAEVWEWARASEAHWLACTGSPKLALHRLRVTLLVAHDRGLSFAAGTFSGVETASVEITDKDLEHCPMARLFLEGLETLYSARQSKVALAGLSVLLKGPLQRVAVSLSDLTHMRSHRQLPTPFQLLALLDCNWPIFELLRYLGGRRTDEPTNPGTAQERDLAELKAISRRVTSTAGFEAITPEARARAVRLWRAWAPDAEPWVSPWPPLGAAFAALLAAWEAAEEEETAGGVGFQAQLLLGELERILWDAAFLAPKSIGGGNGEHAPDLGILAGLLASTTSPWRLLEGLSALQLRFFHRTTCSKNFGAGTLAVRMQTWHSCRYCAKSSGQGWERSVFQHGSFWDVDTLMHIMRTMAKPHGGKCLFIDVGANVGLYSVRAAAEGFSVIAVEPDPRNLRRLVASARLNGVRTLSRLSTLQAAAWAKQRRGTQRLLQSPDESMLTMTLPSNRPAADAHLAASSAVAAAGGGQVRNSSSVLSISLDVLLRMDGPSEFDLKEHSCAFLKVDAEGDDPEVLKGAAGLLSNPKLIGAMVEEHRELLQLKGHKADAVARQLAAYDFRWTHLMDPDPAIRNILVLRPQAAAVVEASGGFQLAQFPQSLRT
ncbi:unnamed protein product [Effrenium voratum]|nr:unnamed protein product [Effrenium voratum]